jgi:conjugal transfer mating pair stabilization protein TraG
MFIFGGDDAQTGEEGGATTIDTGGLVNRNLSQREFVATYGNRLDAQGKAIKDLQESQLPKSAIEQELETLRGENARMLSDGQAAIDAISAENAALRSELETVRATRFSELRDAYTRSRSNETVSGTSTNDSIGRTFSELDNASNTLQQQFGLSRRASDDISVSWFLNGDAGVGAKAEGDVFSGSGGIKGGRNQSWTDSDIGIASEDRSRIESALSQISESYNWSSSREGFFRETSSSSEALVSSSAAGVTTSLTEANSYTVEARRAEELANRLESQASWYESANAAGTLNLSQAYREWGMAEIEANRDYYGRARFDDIDFQMSAQGQQLQARFVESYAEGLNDEIASELELPDAAPVTRPNVGSASGVGGSVRLGGTPSSLGDPSDGRQEIAGDVSRKQNEGSRSIERRRGSLDRTTRDEVIVDVGVN